MNGTGLGRRRILVVTGLWFAAALLILGQLLWIRSLAPANRLAAMTDGHYLVPSETWRLCGTLSPLLLMAIALILQFRWTSAGWRLLTALTTAFFVPFCLSALLLAAIGGPSRIESVRLSDGHRFILAGEPIPTDAVYTLYEAEDSIGLMWRRVSWLDYSEDGRFVGEERLVLSPDERWLLVTRAGIWTDCFRLVRGRPILCGVLPSPSWTDPGYEADMRLRSRRIAELTGLAP